MFKMRPNSRYCSRGVSEPLAKSFKARSSKITLLVVVPGHKDMLCKQGIDASKIPASMMEVDFSRLNVLRWGK
ncbi:hypothetical protein M378DRAFT_1001606 [Amanita muscaria Koide BX008]|uniref:Uncharacterized protein n=1 Tax=Amanita muscaria (strain Koide BX008) TaxID=946122 RepID=A0A0C2S9Z9_AMAMK|nr:hypothetical protein M378DRAFT_1001606 [Amanita muscaria Koide BX008]